MGELLTLVHGATVAVSSRAGDVEPGGYHGVWRHDLRVLSRLALTVGGSPPRLVTAWREGAGRAWWVYELAADPDGSPRALLVRTREVGDGVRERFAVRAWGPLAGTPDIHVALATDLAPLPGRPTAPAPLPAVPYEIDGLARSVRNDDISVEIRARGDRVTATADGFACALEPAAGHEPVLDLDVTAASVRDRPATARPQTAEPDRAFVLAASPPRWAPTVATGIDDLRGLRVEVPSENLRYVAAGAPRYLALFGRDALLTAWESLPLGHGQALDVLRTLADRQGTGTDERTGEQPGRILHELRTGLAGIFGVEPLAAYYGTVDATPLFVMLLAEVHRWGAPTADVRALLPAARAALRWCFEFGDVDGDGFVESVADPGGLANQGWKDSGEALVHADGSRARGPVALAEVQGYVFAACRALALLEGRLGDPGRVAALEARAARLRSAFAEAFWAPARATVALGLDGAKRSLEVATSNIGHVLWTGIVDGDLAVAAADRLSRDDLAATWGLRTLASTEAAYNPFGYHVGSIWPHDTAIGVAGLSRAGRAAAARRLAGGLLRAAESFGWRLPELFGGLDGADAAVPVAYPVACSPQAWSAAAPLLLLRALLRLEPDVPAGVVHVAPILPEGEQVEVGMPLGDGFVRLRASGSAVDVLEIPAGLRAATTAGPG